MDEHRVNRLPVVDGQGWPVGIVARDDVIRALARRARVRRATAGRDHEVHSRLPQMAPD